MKTSIFVYVVVIIFPCLATLPFNNILWDLIDAHQGTVPKDTLFKVRITQ